MEYEYCYLKAVNRTYKYLSLKAVLHKLPVYTAKVKKINFSIDNFANYKFTM